MVAALASFLDARRNRGVWHLRIDDIDPPREAPGSVESISAALSYHGLHWDGPIVFQSQHAPDYERAIQQLDDAGWLFRCLCTRSHLTTHGECGQNCRAKSVDQQASHSLRVRVLASELSGFNDGILGFQPVSDSKIPADFIVRRRDGLYAYQLAAAVDDALPHHTHVVRGADLLESTHRQRWLHHILGLTSPRYAHVPVIRDDEGNKLSKQTGAKAISTDRPVDTLRRCLAHLSQPPPPPSAVTPEEVLEHATGCWPERHSMPPVA